MLTAPQEYEASPAKITFNYFIAGFLILFGGLFALALADDPGYPLGWIGVLTFLAGIGFIIYTRRHNVGRKVILYMDRVEFITGDKTESWAFDDIEEIHVLYNANTFNNPHPSKVIHGYHFLIDGKTAFAVKPIYADWQDLGEKITAEVIKRLSRKYPDQINEEEGVAFSGRVRYRPITPSEAFS